MSYAYIADNSNIKWFTWWQTDGMCNNNNILLGPSSLAYNPLFFVVFYSDTVQKANASDILCTYVKNRLNSKRPTNNERIGVLVYLFSSLSPSLFVNWSVCSFIHLSSIIYIYSYIYPPSLATYVCLIFYLDIYLSHIIYFIIFISSAWVAHQHVTHTSLGSPPLLLRIRIIYDNSWCRQQRSFIEWQNTWCGVWWRTSEAIRRYTSHRSSRDTYWWNKCDVNITVIFHRSTVIVNRLNWDMCSK